MAGNETHSDALRRAYPDAAAAECDGDGWGILTYPDGSQESARCPECEREGLLASVTAFVPPRFQARIGLPPVVAAWARGELPHHQGLYLAGQVGTGKTHTAWHAAIAWCVATGTVPTAHPAPKAEQRADGDLHPDDGPPG